MEIYEVYNYDFSQFKHQSQKLVNASSANPVIFLLKSNSEYAS
jgi:hypothetical protein